MLAFHQARECHRFCNYDGVELPRLTHAVLCLSLLAGSGAGAQTTDTISGPYTVTIVGADGTVLTTIEGTSRLTRFPAQSGEMGTPLAGFPTWIPATPAAATPAL